MARNALQTVRATLSMPLVWAMALLFAAMEASSAFPVGALRALSGTSASALASFGAPSFGAPELLSVVAYGLLLVTARSVGSAVAQPWLFAVAPASNVLGSVCLCAGASNTAYGIHPRMDRHRVRAGSLGAAHRDGARVAVLLLVAVGSPRGGGQRACQRAACCHRRRGALRGADCSSYRRFGGFRDYLTERGDAACGRPARIRCSSEPAPFRLPSWWVWRWYPRASASFSSCSTSRTQMWSSASSWAVIVGTKFAAVLLFVAVAGLLRFGRLSSPRWPRRLSPSPLRPSSCSSPKVVTRRCRAPSCPRVIPSSR